MSARSLTRWSLVLAGLLGVLLVALPVVAQQPSDQPSPQPVAPAAESQPTAPPMPVQPATPPEPPRPATPPAAAEPVTPPTPVQPAAPAAESQPTAAPAATPPAVAPAAAQPAAPVAGTPMPIMQPQPTTVPGRPDIPNAEVNTKLRGVPPPPFPASPDKLPVPQLKLPKGFKIEVYASGIANARSLRLGDKGTVFVSNRQLDKVYAIVDKGGKREVKVIASGLDRPNGLAFHNGTLYIAEGTQISKLDKIEDNLDNPPKPVVIYSDFLNHQSHGWKFMGLGPDNKLYVNVGSPCNICEPPDTNGQIRRISLDGKSADVVARGVRNSVGFDWHPMTKELYFTDNGRDWLSEDLPEDELNRVTKSGQHFGFPYCHQGTFTDREMGWGRSCDEFEKPAALLGPHSAALGMRFYTGNMFPAEYRHAIFIARHGSWNRTKKVGGDIVVAKLNRDGTVRSVQPFLTGFLQNNEYIGRPVDVQMLKDGSLLVSDDYAGAVYRISYGSPPGRVAAAVRAIQR